MLALPHCPPGRWIALVAIPPVRGLPGAQVQVRGAVEEDLGRVFGDAPARARAAVAQRAAGALRGFVGARMGQGAGASDRMRL